MKLKFIKRKPKKSSYHKLYLYVIVVNNGLGATVTRWLQEEDSNVQFVSLASGTASREVLNIIGLDDERKEVIMAFVDETDVERVKRLLNNKLFYRKKHIGVGFTIKLSSIIGEKVYHFLTNTI